MGQKVAKEKMAEEKKEALKGHLEEEKTLRVLQFAFCVPRVPPFCCCFETIAQEFSSPSSPRNWARPKTGGKSCGFGAGTMFYGHVEGVIRANYCQKFLQGRTVSKQIREGEKEGAAVSESSRYFCDKAASLRSATVF